MDKNTLASRVIYNPETGFFHWSNGIRKEKRAGSKHLLGYRMISLFGKRYYEHRLAFVWMTGKLPGTVDHKNKIKDDNRWSNLRECNRAQNSSNRAGYSKNGLPKGVCRNGSKWFFARISVNGKTIYLGNFNSSAEAHIAYIEAAKKYYGDFYHP